MGCNSSKDTDRPESALVTPREDSLPPALPKLTKRNRIHSVPNPLAPMKSETQTHTLSDELSLSRVKTEPHQSRICENYPVVYATDFFTNKFVSYNLETQKWSLNDLSKGALHSTDPKLIPLKPLKETVLEYLTDATPILISDSVIHFIGEKHFAYDIKLNLFSYRKSREEPAPKNPTLCRIGDDIFAFSGNEHSRYSTKCEKYNMLTNTWTTLAPLSEPYYKGSACGYVDYTGAYKIVLLGGLASKDSKQVNQTMAIYDISADRWTEVRINLPVQINVSAPNLPLFLHDDGVVCLVAVKGEKIQPFYINLSNGKVTVKRQLPPKEKMKNPVIESFNYPHKGNCALVLTNQVQAPAANKLVPEKLRSCIIFSTPL